jgi:hypothetical protein
MADPAPFVAGFYRDQQAFVAACGAAVAAGHHPQAFTPYPVHGIEKVLGIRRSLIGRPVLAVILVGFCLGLHLTWYTMSQDWPLNVGGKPFFAWQTFLVVIMETGLLLGALANMGLALHFCRLLPAPDTRLLNDRLTDDTFALVLPVRAQEGADVLVGWLMAQHAEEAQVFGAATAADGQRATEAAHV